MIRDTPRAIQHISIRYLLLITLVILSVAAGSVSADCNDLSCAYNPNPDPKEDFILPMPGDFFMVFRQVRVPGGAGFWGNTDRIVKVGDIQGDGGERAVFEGVQKLPISGSFMDKDGWYYYLGKYEVTIGQYLTVLGKGNIKQAVESLIKEKPNTEFSKDTSDLLMKIQTYIEKKSPGLYRTLAQPASGLTWFEYQKFMQEYNLWCYSTPDCLEKLPRLPARLTSTSSQTSGENPGFIRLPTNMEWEFAARGGLSQLANSDLFNQKLPAGDISTYAWTEKNSKGKGPTRIGRMKDVYGFYDLVGNVQELMVDIFRAEFSQGKSGALSARGGSYFDTVNNLRISQRTEISLYQTRGNTIKETRSLTTGLRLSIGSLVVESERYRDDIVAQYQDYITRVRKDTSAGQSTANPISRANNVTIREAQELLTSTLNEYQNDPILRNRLGKLYQYLQSAEKEIDEGTAMALNNLVATTLVFLDSAGTMESRSFKTLKAIATLKKSAEITGKTSLVESVKEKYEKETDSVERNFNSYARNMILLRGYSSEKEKLDSAIKHAMNEFKRKKAPPEVIRAYIECEKLLRKHLDSAENRDLWRKDLREMVLNTGVYQ